MRARLAVTDDNRRWWTLAAMCFALFMVMLDNTVVNVALPSIQNDLHSSIAGLQWTVNAYTLAFGVLLVTGGRLGDIFGRRRDLSHRRRHLRRLEPVHRLLAVLGLAHRRPRRPGRRRGADDAGDAVDHHERLPAARARARDRHVGRRLGARAGDRAGARRPARRARLLAVDLLHQPPRRRRRDRRHAVRHARVARRDGPADRRLRGRRSDHGRPDRADARRSSRPATGAGARRACSALFALAAAGLAAFAAIERRVVVPMVDFSFFRLAHVPRREHRRVHRLLRDARDVLLPQPLHAEHPALLALEAGIRFLPTTLMVIVVAPDAGPPDRPHRAAAAHDRGARARRRRARVAIVSHPHVGLRLPAARIRGDGHRDRARHVADDDGRDERRRSQQGGRRIRGSCR